MRQHCLGHVAVVRCAARAKRSHTANAHYGTVPSGPAARRNAGELTHGERFQGAGTDPAHIAPGNAGVQDKGRAHSRHTVVGVR